MDLFALRQNHDNSYKGPWGTFDFEMDWGAWSVDEQCERDTGL